jgi:hypothetical protein
MMFAAISSGGRVCRASKQPRSASTLASVNLAQTAILVAMVDCCELSYGS